ncbi:MAG: helix-turn-helix domain-containing protein [Chloroflexota bacterium]
MTRIATPSARPYRSELRARQAEETRSRILDATIRVMAKGIASVSIPDVAREAGVSVPTVYRHFGTKAALLTAIYPHLARRAGLGELSELVEPESVDEFSEMVRTLFGRLETLGDEARIAMSSPASEDARRSQMPRRYAMSRRFAATVMPSADAADLDRLARLLIVLASSSAMRMWRDHLGSSVDEAADDIHWLLRSITAPAQMRKTR